MSDLWGYDKTERQQAMVYESKKLGLTFVEAHALTSGLSQTFTAKDSQGNNYRMGLYDNVDGFRVRVLTIES